MRLFGRPALALLFGAGAQVLFASSVRAHAGPGVNPEHLLLDVAQWALAVGAVLGAVVLVFWVRSKRRGA